MEIAGERFQQHLEPRGSSRGPQGGGGIGRIDRVGQHIDADPQHQGLHVPSCRFGFGQDARDLGAVDEEVVRPLAGDPARAWQA